MRRRRSEILPSGHEFFRMSLAHEPIQVGQLMHGDAVEERRKREWPLAMRPHHLRHPVRVDEHEPAPARPLDGLRDHVVVQHEPRPERAPDARLRRHHPKRAVPREQKRHPLRVVLPKPPRAVAVVGLLADAHPGEPAKRVLDPTLDLVELLRPRGRDGVERGGRPRHRDRLDEPAATGGERGFGRAVDRCLDGLGLPPVELLPGLGPTERLIHLVRDDDHAHSARALALRVGVGEHRAEDRRGLHVGRRGDVRLTPAASGDLHAGREHPATRRRIAFRGGLGSTRGRGRHRLLDAAILGLLPIEVADSTCGLGDGALDVGVPEGLGHLVGDLGAAGVVVTFGVDPLVVGILPHRLVFALHLVHEVGERPRRLVLQPVAGGVHGVAAGAGPNRRRKVDHDVGLQPASLGRRFDLKQPSKAEIVGPTPIAGRPPVRLHGGGRALAPRALDAHTRATTAAEHRLHFDAVEQEPDAGEVIRGEELAQPVLDADVHAARSIPVPHEVGVDVGNGQERALAKGGVEHLDLGIRAVRDREVVAGVHAPAEASADAQNHGLRHAEAPSGLSRVRRVAFAALTDRQELVDDGVRVHRDAVVLERQRALLRIPGDTEVTLVRLDLTRADRSLDRIDGILHRFAGREPWQVPRFVNGLCEISPKDGYIRRRATRRLRGHRLADLGHAAELAPEREVVEAEPGDGPLGAGRGHRLGAGAGHGVLRRRVAVASSRRRAACREMKVSMSSGETPRGGWRRTTATAATSWSPICAP